MILFKWNKDNNKNTGSVVVESGAYRDRRVIGNILRGKGTISACIMFGNKTKGFAGANATELKELITESLFAYNNEEVEVIAMSGKKVMIRRSALGTVCDPSTESYYTF